MSHSMATSSRNKRKTRSSPEWETQPQRQPPSPNADPDIPSLSSSVADNFSSPSMKPLVFPPGYKFTPSDEELLFYYLKPFSQGNRYLFLHVPIHHVNIYKSNPQHLSEKYEKANEKEWIFITERTNLCEGGKNKNRCANGGYWKLVTSKTINAGQGVVGNMTTLTYFEGKQPNGVKGDWLMHEYWFESSSNNKEKVDHALCKIYLTPSAEKKKKKAEEKKKRKLMIEEGVAIVDVEALGNEIELPSKVEYQQPQMQQPHDFVYQQPQYPLLPLVPQYQSQPQNYDYLPQQPQMQQPHDIVYQQPPYPLLPLVPQHQSQPQNYDYLPQQPSAQHQKPQPQLLPFPSNLDSLYEMFKFQQPPEIPNVYNDILTNTSGLLMTSSNKE